ncbi:MAG TPA: MMPL family transporter [Rectinemataceae bacterium]|nr:MMPL family transporter [Rectinemataceae bacterium]
MKRFWKWMLDHAWAVIGIFVILTAFMVLGARQIRQDASAGAMNPDHSAIVELNDRIDKAFNTGRSEIFVLHAPDIYAPGRLDEIRVITKNLEAIEGVKKVTSLATTTMMVDKDGVLTTSEMLGEGEPSPEQIAAIRKYIEGNYILKTGLIVAKDGRSTNIMVEFDDAADLPTIATRMERAVSGSWTGSYDLAGIPTIESAMLATIRRDLPLLAGLAILVIFALFLLNFRSALGALMPLLQIVMATVWGAGLFGWIGLKFQALTIIAPIAILAVGSSFTLHLLGRYFLELSRGLEKKRAILRMLEETGLGVFVSGLAIAASMTTFLLSDLGMVRGLGAFAALGVASSMLMSLSLLPALLAVLPRPRPRLRLEGDSGLSRRLDGLGLFVGRHPKAILLVGGAILLVASFGIFRIVPNTSLIGFFRSDSSVIKGMRAVDRAFGGSTSVKMLIDGDLQDPGLLKAMLAYQEDVRSIPGMASSTSIASLMRTIHEALTGEKGLPGSRDLVAQELLVYQSSGTVDDLATMTNLDYTEGLVTFIVPRMSTHDTEVLFVRLKDLAKRDIGDRAKVSFAGDILSETAIEEVIIHDFIISLTLALALVILIDSLIRSLRAALVTISVLMFTIVLQYGILGIFNLPFNLATALAGALAIGVGDYAIHFTVRYMEERRGGKSPEAAVRHALATSGRSVFFTALTIGGGFAVMTFSQFMPVATLGSVMVITVAIVGLATLSLLPAACLVFLRNPISRMEVENDAHVSFIG